MPSQPVSWMMSAQPAALASSLCAASASTSSVRNAIEICSTLASLLDPTKRSSQGASFGRYDQRMASGPNGSLRYFGTSHGMPGVATGMQDSVAMTLALPLDAPSPGPVLSTIVT